MQNKKKEKSDIVHIALSLNQNDVIIVQDVENVFY